jgi:fructoselysine-6-P-deglycase FrlB-like protein
VLIEGIGETAERAEAALVGWRLDRLRRALEGPLAVVASGGTMTAAQLWVLLHRQAGHAAWALTPDALAEEGVPAGTRVLILSAAGRHHDVLRAARLALEAGASVHAVVGDADAPLGALLRGHDDAHQVFVLPRSERRDQVLAVHALVPFLVLAGQLYGDGGPYAPLFAEAKPAATPEARPGMVVTLGAGLGGPAAFDFAWRTLESGLGPAWHTDVRNFAHGAFMPLVGRSRDALVLSFAPRSQRAYLDRYFRAFDPEVTVVRVETPHEGAFGALDLLGRGLATSAALLAGHGVSPRVEDLPPWGTAIYFLARPNS